MGISCRAANNLVKVCLVLNLPTPLSGKQVTFILQKKLPVNVYQFMESL